MFAALLLAFLAGAGFHAVLVAVALGPWAIARRGGLDVRPALKRREYTPALEAGVRVAHQRRRETLGEPPNFEETTR